MPADTGRDDVTCLIEFANNAVGVVENSWAKRGGMDDKIEVFGSDGLTYPNLHMGNALPTYSEHGFAYRGKGARNYRVTWPVFEELWNYGFPQEMRISRAAFAQGDAAVNR